MFPLSEGEGVEVGVGGEYTHKKKDPKAVKMAISLKKNKKTPQS